MQDIKTKLEPLFPYAAAAKRLIAIISYDLVAKLPPTIAAAFQMIICDESHSLKGPNTDRTRCIAPLVKRARRAVLLSGTPLKSHPIELHTQVCFSSCYMWCDLVGAVGELQRCLQQ